MSWQLLIGGWKRAFFEQRQSVKRPYYDECTNEEGCGLKHSMSTSACQILANQPFPSIQWVVRWVSCPPCLPLRPSSENKSSSRMRGKYLHYPPLLNHAMHSKRHVPLTLTMKARGDIIHTVSVRILRLVCWHRKRCISGPARTQLRQQ